MPYGPLPVHFYLMHFLSSGWHGVALSSFNWEGKTSRFFSGCCKVTAVLPGIEDDICEFSHKGTEWPAQGTTFK